MNNQDKIRIDISGGDWKEREMLTDLVSGQLYDRGFNNVKANNATGNQVPAERIGANSPRTVLDYVSAFRPDLMDKEILVVPAPKDSIYDRDNPRTGPVGAHGFPGVTTMVRTASGTTIDDLQHYDNPAAMIDRAFDLGEQVSHVGIRANNFPAAIDAVRQALVCAPNAYVTVSMTDDMWPNVGAPASKYFNTPEKDITPPADQLGYSDSATMSALRQQIANDLVTSEGFQEFVEDITRDMIDERMRDVNRDLVDNQERTAEKIAKTISQEMLARVDDSIATGQPYSRANDYSDLKRPLVYVPPKVHDNSPSAQILREAGKALEDKGFAPVGYPAPNGHESREAVRNQFRGRINSAVEESNKTLGEYQPPKEDEDDQALARLAKRASDVAKNEEKKLRKVTKALEDHGVTVKPELKK